MNTPQHCLIARYLSRADPGTQTIRADGRATIVVDDTYRVHLVPEAGGGFWLVSRIAALPAPGSVRDTMLLEFGRLAAGMLSAHASGCVVDSRQQSIWLQQSVHPDSPDVDVDEAVGQFVNALSFWTRVAGRIA